MKFIDETAIEVTAGRGGDGMVSFKRAKNKPKLGPDGGNGGRGGDVLLVAERRHSTLAHLRYRQKFRAESGSPGASNLKTGRCGEPLRIGVPLGTVVTDAETGEVLGEMTSDQSVLCAAHGGQHGLGNAHMVRATHQAPYETRPAGSGETRKLRLELKLMADVGFAGHPNAGKSTLLARLTAAKPRIADYPFTTLVPNLGVVNVGDPPEDSYVLADVPGLIAGASQGRGLGHAFLKHLERTRTIAYVVDAHACVESALSPVGVVQGLHAELAAFDGSLADRARVVILNKIDLLSDDEVRSLEEACVSEGFRVVSVSGATGQGCATLGRQLYDALCEARREARAHDGRPELVRERDAGHPPVGGDKERYGVGLDAPDASFSLESLLGAREPNAATECEVPS